MYINMYVGLEKSRLASPNANQFQGKCKSLLPIDL